MTTRRRAGEFEIIARHFAPLAAGLPGALGLLDDACVLTLPEGRALVATADGLVAGVHFRPQDRPEDVAAKSLRVNLSDLAAMGAEPLVYLVVLALDAAADDAWIEGFARGLAEDQRRYGIALAGGDTVATPGPLSVTITALGTVARERELRRSGAQPGDKIYVSGTVGDAALGLLALNGRLAGGDGGSFQPLVERYLRPEPRLKLGAALVGLAHAAADVSDGLVADLGHICDASGLGAEIEAARVPLSPATRALVAREPGLIETALTGGDDYELVVTAAAEDAAALAAVAERVGVPLTAIGRMVEAGAGRVRVLAEDGRELALASTGYRHF